MTTADVTQILVAVARVEGRLDAQATGATRAEERLNAHSSRLDKLERLAYVALGAAIASGVPQLVAIFR